MKDKYIEIEEFVMEEIEEGRLKPGDRLPTEKELREKFEVSRETVRQALQLLSMRNIIEKIKGSGSYVTGDAIKTEIKIKSESNKILKDETRFLEFKEMEPSFQLTQKMLTTNKIFRGEKVHCIDGKPVALEIRYLRKKIFPQYTKQVFSDNDETVYANSNIKIDKILKEIYPYVPTKKIAATLNIDLNHGLLVKEKIKYAEDVPVELIIYCYNPKYFKFII